MESEIEPARWKRGKGMLVEDWRDRNPVFQNARLIRVGTGMMGNDGRGRRQPPEDAYRSGEGGSWIPVVAESLVPRAALVWH